MRLTDLKVFNMRVSLNGIGSRFRICKLWVRVPPSASLPKYGRVEQLVARLVHTQKVGGPSPPSAPIGLDLADLHLVVLYTDYS